GAGGAGARGAGAVPRRRRGGPRAAAADAEQARPDGGDAADPAAGEVSRGALHQRGDQRPLLLARAGLVGREEPLRGGAALPGGVRGARRGVRARGGSAALPGGEGGGGGRALLLAAADLGGRSREVHRHAEVPERMGARGEGLRTTVGRRRGLIL